jgi:hypothetical protein
MTDTEYREKLFGQLDTLQNRQTLLVRGVLVTLGILIVANLLFLFVALPQKTEEIQRSNVRITDVATTTTTALCALRGDLERRVARGQTFLQEHPRGIPGFRPAFIRSTLDGQARTIVALSVVKCPPT